MDTRRPPPSPLPPPPLPLPLSTFLSTFLPSHPLPNFLTQPILSRLALIEARLLLSRPATLLLRLGLASERGFIVVVLAAVLGAVGRWRAQWRGMLWALGVGEALGRTVRVLRATGSDGKRRTEGADGAAEEQQQELDELQDETNHLLSFWLLFSLLSLFSSLRSSPSSGPSASHTSFALPQRLRAALRTFRHTYLAFLRRYVLPTFLRTRYASQQLLQRYPRLDPSPLTAKLPQLWLPALLQRRAPSRLRANFPQPRDYSSASSLSLPLAWSYLRPRISSALLSPSSATEEAASAERRWETLKLLLLWVGLRKDGWGAKSVLWEGILAPLFGGSEGGDAGDRLEITARRTVSAGEVAKEARRAASPPPVTEYPSSTPSITSQPPYTTSWTSQGPATPSATSQATTPRRPRTRSTSPTPVSAPTPSSAPFAFPTPVSQQPYRAVSASHPLIPFSLSLPTSAAGRNASPVGSASSTATATERGRVQSAPPLSTSGSGSATSFSSVPAKSRNRDSLLFESPPRSLHPHTSSSSRTNTALHLHLHSRNLSSSSSSSTSLSQLTASAAAVADGQDDEGGGEWDAPPTPGEEEAEEAVGGWGAVLERVSTRGSEVDGEEEERR